MRIMIQKYVSFCVLYFIDTLSQIVKNYVHPLIPRIEFNKLRIILAAPGALAVNLLTHLPASGAIP